MSAAKFPRGLGVLVGGESCVGLIAGIGQAVDAGYRTVQLNLTHHHFTEEEIREIAAAVRQNDLEVAAVGVYCDLLRPESDHFFGTSVDRDLVPMIPLCRELGANSLIAWTGSLAEGLLDEHPQNQTEASRASLRRTLDRLRPLLKEHGVKLLFEPWHTHVLGGAEDMAAEILRDPAAFAAVVDLPNFLRGRKEFDRREEILPRLVDTLIPIADIVHLKDIAYSPEGEMQLPGAGKGALDYPEILRMLSPLWERVPYVIEHVDAPDFASTGAFVLGAMVRGA
ncbi:MAG: TIM barrel protein [Terrimicrobiaceae bacterium]